MHDAASAPQTRACGRATTNAAIYLFYCFEGLQVQVEVLIVDDYALYSRNGADTESFSLAVRKTLQHRSDILLFEVRSPPPPPAGTYTLHV